MEVIVRGAVPTRSTEDRTYARRMVLDEWSRIIHDFMRNQPAIAPVSMPPDLAHSILAIAIESRSLCDSFGLASRASCMEYRKLIYGITYFSNSTHPYNADRRHNGLPWQMILWPTAHWMRRRCIHPSHHSHLRLMNVIP